MARDRGGILKTSLGLLVLTLGSRLLAMVREMLLANRIGMNYATDAFNISQSAITFVTGTIGATCMSLVPLLISYASEDDNRRDEVFTSLFCMYMGVALVIAVGLTLYARDICVLLGPSLAPEAKVLAADLLRIGFIKVNCVVAGSLFAYYLQSKSVFIASGLSALLGNLAVVILLFSNHNATIFDYAVYTVVGLALQAVIPLPLLAKARYRPRIKQLVEKEALKRLLMASVPLMGAMMFLEVQTLFSRAIATGLGEGAASSVDYANKIIQLLYASVTTSLNGVLYTRISESAAAGDDKRTLRYLVAGGRNQLVFVLPMSLLLAIFGKPLIALLFQRGHFTAENTVSVYHVLIGYLIGAWPYVFADLFSKYYVVLGRYGLINFINAFGYCVSLAIVVPLSRTVGAIGLSLSFSIAQICILLGFAGVSIHGTRASDYTSLVMDCISFKDLFPAFLLACSLLAYRSVFGLPTPIGSVLLSIAFGLAYLLLLKPLGVRVGFNE